MKHIRGPAEQFCVQSVARHGAEGTLDQLLQHGGPLGSIGVLDLT